MPAVCSLYICNKNNHRLLTLADQTILAADALRFNFNIDENSIYRVIKQSAQNYYFGLVY